MKTEEKQKKFHDALLNMLYPQPPSSHEKVHKEQPKNLIVNPNLVDISKSDINADELEDEGKTSSSDDDDGDEECGMEKMSRSRRKRIRKRKLKEAKSQRRKIIGPLLISGNGDSGTERGESLRSPQGVRRFASEEKSNSTEEASEVVFDTKRSKRKQRRMAKKMGREREKLACVLGEKKYHGQETDHDEEEETVEESKQGIQ